MQARPDRFKPVRWWHAALVVLWTVFWWIVGSAGFGNQALGSLLSLLAFVIGIVFLTGLGRWRR